jgi:tRNA pseudouridine38-40 synthase
MTRYKVILEYDGTNLIGWQENRQGPSVQSIMKDAIEKFCGARPDVIGAGRTDAGVHAVGTVAHFDIDGEHSANTVMRAVNFYLVGKPVAILGCEIVSDDFNARFDCKGKEYIYKVWNSRVRNPFLKDRALHHPIPINEKLLDKECKAFIGYHDFSAFCANKNMKKSTNRYISHFEIIRKENELVFCVTGNGFLHHMVRIMVGTLLEVGRGKRRSDSIPSLFGAPRAQSGELIPSCGLCLMEVTY